MIDSFTCPYCSSVFPITNDTSHFQYPSFKYYDDTLFDETTGYTESCIQLSFYKCPKCGKYSIDVIGVGDSVNSIQMHIKPNSLAKQFPEYIPKQIIQDYEEACAIVYLSPKASATLSRRCLQGMIHDFWNIKSKNLSQEITSLKDKIPADLWEAINALRELGNIGAHMENDTDLIIEIDPNEADSLIKLIELLMKEWYINREERKKLLSDIKSTNLTKQNERKKTE